MSIQELLAGTANGGFTECVKTGFKFSTVDDDRVFTGDLHFNFVHRKFLIKGIPSCNGHMVHVLPKNEPGPVVLMGRVTSIEASEVRDGTSYIDMVVKSMCISESFADWVEYWYGDRAVASAIRDTWEVVSGLVWVKP